MKCCLPTAGRGPNEIDQIQAEGGENSTARHNAVATAPTAAHCPWRLASAAVAAGSRQTPPATAPASPSTPRTTRFGVVATSDSAPNLPRPPFAGEPGVPPAVRFVPVPVRAHSLRAAAECPACAPQSSPAAIALPRFGRDVSI